MVADNDSDDQTASETKKPKTRGTRPTDRGATPAGAQTMAATSSPAQTRQMPWDRGGGFGAQGGAGGAQQAGGHPAFQWGGGGMHGGGGSQPGGIMGGEGQGRHGGHGMPDWHALAQQFVQRFQGHPMLQRLGQTGMGMRPPGQAPAAPPQGAPQGQPGSTPPIWAGPQAAQGMQPGAAPQGGPLQGRIQQLAQMFGRQQPGGITGGPGQGPTY